MSRPVDLRQHDVGPGVQARGALDLVAKLPGGRHPHDRVVPVRRRDQLGHRREFGVVPAWPPESEPRDRRGVGQVEPGVFGHRRHDVSDGAGTPVQSGSGLIQSMLMLATSKPSEL